MLCRFVLELGHAGQLAELCIAGKYPCKLAVRRHMGLDKKQALFGVYAHGNEQSICLKNLFSEGGGLLADGYGVQIGHGIDAVILLLEPDPVSECAEIIA